MDAYINEGYAVLRMYAGGFALHHRLDRTEVTEHNKHFLITVL